jgi:PhnB protein
MRLNPYLTFDGRCKAAFEFYEKCLNAKIVVIMTYGESPLAGQAPDDWRDKILHATLTWGDYVLQGADSLPGNYCKPQGFSVLLNLDTATEADRIFDALAEGGTVRIPLRESFWASRFGTLTDRFGTPWTINCGKPA